MKRIRQIAVSMTGTGLLAGWVQAGVLVDYDADAGNPASAAEIQSPIDQGWTEAGTGSAIIVEGSVDSGTNAWRISDDASGANPSYTTALSTADLTQMFLNGWEFEMVVQAVRGAPQSGFCGWGLSAGNDPGWGLSDRERVGFGVERESVTDAFQVTPIHGGTVTLAAGTGTGFHTIRCVGIPASPQYEFFIDGISQGVFDIRDGGSNGNYDDVLRFASGSTGGTGREAAWNRVRLAANDPLVVVTPSDGTTVVDEEGPTSDSFTVHLSQVPGTAVTVTVAVAGGSLDLDFGMGPGASVELAFSPLDFDTPQPVTVTAVDDADEELDEVVTVTATAASGDTFFDGEQSALPVTVLDNDLIDPQLKVSAGVFISPQTFNQGSYVTDPGEYHTFRIPSLIVAPDESLLAFAEGRRGRGHDPRREGNAPIDLVMSRSIDHGVTWSALEVVDPGHQTNGWLVDFADPTAVIDDTTEPPTLWLLYGQWPDLGPISPVPGNDPDPAATNQVIWVRSSIDNGTTWSARNQIFKPVGPPDSPDGLYWRHGEPGPGNGIQLRWQEGANAALNGRLLIPAKRNGSTTPDGSVSTEPFSYYSDDHGATWQVGNPTAGPDGNEDEVVELSNGQILLDARQHGGNFRRRHLSSDGGVNWGADLSDDVPVTKVDGSVDRYSARRAGDDRDRILFSCPAGNPVGSGSGRHNITVWTSYDEGESFINPVQLDEGPAAYSVVRTLPNGDIGVFVETDGDDGVLYGKIEYFGFGIDFLEGMIHPRRLTHYDGFGNRIDRTRGGTGWSGPWSAGATFTDVPVDEFGSAGIGFPDFDRSRSFGRVDLVGAQSTARDLARTIDLAIDDRVYVSVLVSRQLDVSANGATDEELKIEMRDAGGVVQAAFGIDSEEAFFVDELGARQTGPAGGLAVDTSYLLVLKIVATASGGDQLLLKAYPAGGFGSGSVESDVAWTVTGGTGENSAAVLERLALTGGAESHWSVDEIRIGETWHAVAGEDTDADGLDDAWEIKHFTTLESSDGTGDADGDGMSDADEQTAGTDPRNVASRFDAAIRSNGGGVLLSWPSAEGRDYGIDSSANLEPGSWLAAQSGIFATPPTNSFTMPSSGDRAFYRVEIEL